MKELFDQVEMPLVFALHDMEREGVLVKAGELKTYGEQLQVKIAQLEQEIYRLAGEEFNINSPKQLGVILFEKLKMPYGKKTKTGYSTAADVLEKLAPDYPLVDQILEYRQLTKLKSTYADGLAAFIGPDGRIHSRFNQTITATGRIYVYLLSQPAEHPGADRAWQAASEGVCAKGGLCVPGRRLLPD